MAGQNAQIAGRGPDDDLLGLAGVAIVLLVMGITLVGESLNDLADPRLRIRRAPRRKVASPATETKGVE